MKIGFDISQTGALKAGCGYFGASLIETLETANQNDEFLLYPCVGDAFWDPQYGSSTYRPRTPRARRLLEFESFDAAKRFWCSADEHLEDQLGRPDVFHALNFYTPRHLRHARLIYTLYDLDFLVHPDWTTEANRLACFYGVTQASLHADMIAAISEYSRKQFLEVFPHYPEERTRTVLLASRFHSESKKTRPKAASSLQPGSFFLSVSTLQPRKNFPRLLKAWAAARQRVPSLGKLVLTGASGWLNDELERTVAGLADRDAVVFTGYLSDEELAWLYANCATFVFPSLAEGFGLPVLEAMSLGAPVICSNTTSLPEVAGDAAILVDPLSESGISLALERVWADADLRSRLSVASLERAREFSWERAARQMLHIYSEALQREKYRAGPPRY